jgi:agmatinase
VNNDESELMKESRAVGPVDPWRVPRFAGIATFARLPMLEDLGKADVGVVGVPFDSGVTYRPGARFGPSAVRQASRLLRPYDLGLDTEPFVVQQVVDAGDIACTPFDIARAIAEIEVRARELLDSVQHIVAIGGDHTIALPLLRAVAAKTGQVALIHLDAHLDTWDTYFGASYTHGTPFRRAFEEGIFAEESSIHIGLRGSLPAKSDLVQDAAMGFRVLSSSDIGRLGPEESASQIRQRVGDYPVYLSIDIDVLDPAFAPGTGTPEAGGLSSREALDLLRALQGLPIVGCDVVEVAPPFDHAEITAIAASHILYELLGLIGNRSRALDSARTASPPELHARP